MMDRNVILALNRDARLLEPDLDVALVGVAHQAMLPVVALYSTRKLVRFYQRRGMDIVDARQHVELNVKTRMSGPDTPVYLMED